MAPQAITATASSTSSASPQYDRRRPDAVAVIACGAIAQDVERVVATQGWRVNVFPLPPLLHNRPERIASAVEELAASLLDRYSAVAVGYADCGTYGALDDVCGRLGLTRLGGNHCYDVLAGEARLRELFE